MKELYRKFDRLMKSCTVVSIIALVGCAQTAPKLDVTHNWTATDKRLAKTFRMHDRQCAQDLYSVTDYETCMTERGYVLLSQR